MPRSNVLAVDDRPENLVAIDSILKDLEIQLFKAFSGQEALEKVIKEEFAMVLLDAHMPEMDGFETARMLRSIKKTQNIPIIFVTAINREEQHIFEGYSSGAVDYMFKPSLASAKRIRHGRTSRKIHSFGG